MASLVKKIDGIATLMIPDQINLNENSVKVHLQGEQRTGTPKPEWAGELTDRRDVLQWDSEQYVAQIGIKGKLALAVVDTGSCKTLICKKTA